MKYYNNNFDGGIIKTKAQPKKSFGKASRLSGSIKQKLREGVLKPYNSKAPQRKLVA